MLSFESSAKILLASHRRTQIRRTQIRRTQIRRTQIRRTQIRRTQIRRPKIFSTIKIFQFNQSQVSL